MSEAPFIRMFVAVAIADETRDALARLMGQARRLNVRIGWTRPENLHVTLAFLGDVDRAAIPSLQNGLDAAAGTMEPFTFETAGVGWFGGRQPRVWWAGVGEGPGRESLCRLASVVSAAVKAAGCPDDARDAFVPHVTLGRTRPGAQPDPLVRFLDSRQGAAVFGITRADRILLMSSSLTPDGPRYETLHESLLGGAKPA